MLQIKQVPHAIKSNSKFKINNSYYNSNIESNLSYFCSNSLSLKLWNTSIIFN